ncbi:MAG: esterase [Candidatus Hydrogenedentes bacterium]|nr:esterase [Candidatus Hydrogenedentota bacterium]
MNKFRSAAVVGCLLGLAVLPSCCPASQSITVDGVKRTYQLHVPPSVSTDPIPLVVALHPLLLNGCQMQQMTGFDDIADREGFAVAYPDGIGRRWDVLSNGGRDVRFISALIDELIRQYNFDPARVYAAGASNGAMMCHQLACCIPDRLAAIAAVMGTPAQTVLDQCQCEKPMPVLIIHGTNDPILPYNGEPGQSSLVSAPAAAAFWAARNGCSGDPSVTRMPDTDPSDGTTIDLIRYPCPDDGPVLFYRVNGGGHTWPGHQAVFPEWITGRISRDMDASEVVWEFFKTRAAGG